MADFAQDASLAAKKAQDSELLALRQQVDRLKGDLTPGQNSQQKLRKACTDFEAVFISKMWEQMRATIPKSGLMHSPQEDMYRSMFDRDFAEKMAGDGGIGLGDMLYKQLKDKLKNTTKITGKAGLDTLAAAKAEAEASKTGAVPAKSAVGAVDLTKTSGTPSTVSGTLDRPSHPAPLRPMGSAGGQSGTAVSAKKTIGKAPESTPTITSPRANGSLSLGSSAGGAPKRPASVPGDVMADVETLAKRIEADYDHRQLVNGVQPSAAQTTAQSSSQTMAQATAQSAAAASGYGASGFGGAGAATGQEQGIIYGQTGRMTRAGTGRKLATIG
ncbi:rod-binding protein [Humidesulfovibrio idahonensis]